MAATLWSLADSEPERAELLASVANRLSELLPIRDIRIRTNDANQQYELELQELNGQWLGVRALSEGTLRFLALATLEADPNSVRLLCMEEPENGIHPLRLPAMLALLKDIAVDATEKPGSDNPLRQVLVNTHSPRLVQLLERELKECLLIAESATVSLGDELIRTVSFRHRLGTWRDTEEDQGVGVGVASAYLTTPLGGQTDLFVADG